MKLLQSHAALEALLGRDQASKDIIAAGKSLPKQPFTIIYFTATWCSACKALDTDAVELAVPEVAWLKCDIDTNDYSPGYCGIRSIPTFVAFDERKILAKLTSNSTEKVIAWSKELCQMMA